MGQQRAPSQILLLGGKRMVNRSNSQFNVLVGHPDDHRQQTPASAAKTPVFAFARRGISGDQVQSRPPSNPHQWSGLFQALADECQTGDSQKSCARGGCVIKCCFSRQARKGNCVLLLLLLFVLLILLLLLLRLRALRPRNFLVSNHFSEGYCWGCEQIL